MQTELRRRFESEAIERALAARPRRRSDNDFQIALVQIKSDFLEVQVVNRGLRKFASPGEPVDLKTVVKSAGEIYKLAERLKQNLELPKPDKPVALPNSTGRQGIDPLRWSIADLSNSIFAFVENPVFEKAGVVDAELSARAGLDLERIIAISKLVKKNAKKLKP